MHDHLKADSTPIDDDAAEHLVDAYEGAVEPEHIAVPPATMTGESLLGANQPTDDEPGDPETEALLAEIEHRHLGFVTTRPYTPAAVAAMPLYPELVAALEDDVLARAMDAASVDDRPVLLAEMARRGSKV